MRRIKEVLYRGLGERFRNPETVRPEEIPGPREPAIWLINSQVGVGKTTVAHALARKLGIRQPQSASKLLKDLQKKNGGLLGYVARSDVVDRTIDGAQTIRMQDATADKPYIGDGHLGAVILAELRAEQRERKIHESAQIEEEKIPFPNTLCILLTTNTEKQRERLIKREQPKHKKLTPDEIWKRSMNRQRLDIVKYKRLHPKTLNDKTPYDPDLKDQNGRPIYDVVIDTSNLTVAQVVEIILEEAKNRGFKVEPRKRRKPLLPSFGVIFDRYRKA